MSAAVLTPGQIRALKLEQLALLEEKERRFMGNRLTRYCAYPKQLEFHAAGKTWRERLFKAGNQLGKTLSAANETAMHLTGRYPDWWPGRTWDRGVSAWAAGVTNEVTRDSVQLLLMGKKDHFGTGSIPRDAIKDYAWRRGVQDAIETVVVRHGGGGDVQASESILGIKSYEQGRAKFQAATLDFVWLDEEPDDYDLYLEALTRTNATDGMAFLTFTPLMGMTATVKRFLIDQMPGTHVTTMAIYDVTKEATGGLGHYTRAQADAIVAGYPAHTRKARAMGIPTLGSGLIFPIDLETIKVARRPIPEHWARIGGIDFGWTHPAAAVDIAHDREADVVYVTKAHRQKEQTPLLFANAIKPWGDWLPWAWPHDALNETQAAAGQALKEQYKGHGLKMLDDKATNPPEFGKEEGSGGTSVEAGLLDMLDRMQTGRFKVFDDLGDWFEEAAMYHRKDGKIVKLEDDLMSATRYACMMLRHAKTRPVPAKAWAYKQRMVT